MTTRLRDSLVVATGLLAATSALAHPGAHGGGGLWAAVFHLMGEHGYLLILLLGIGALAMRDTWRA